jgi:NAD(P)-dependent dehydrogenase (short-subunit alcohol dehydrogenase family)
MKGGVEVLTRHLAKELGPRGISVNTIAPGAVATDFGGVVAALLAEESGWINAQRIEVSGGALL